MSNISTGTIFSQSVSAVAMAWFRHSCKIDIDLKINKYSDFFGSTWMVSLRLPILFFRGLAWLIFLRICPTISTCGIFPPDLIKPELGLWSPEGRLSIQAYFIPFLTKKRARIEMCKKVCKIIIYLQCHKKDKCTMHWIEIR